MKLCVNVTFSLLTFKMNVNSVHIAGRVKRLCRAGSGQSDTAEYCDGSECTGTVLCWINTLQFSISIDHILVSFFFQNTHVIIATSHSLTFNINAAGNVSISGQTVSLFWNNVACTVSSHNCSYNIDWSFLDKVGETVGKDWAAHNGISTVFLPLLFAVLCYCSPRYVYVLFLSIVYTLHKGVVTGIFTVTFSVQNP